jgi:hypothetical protein
MNGLRRAAPEQIDEQKRAPSWRAMNLTPQRSHGVSCFLVNRVACFGGE